MLILKWISTREKGSSLNYIHVIGICAIPLNTITSQLFGDDLPKAVKDIAEANSTSSKIHGDRRSVDRRDKRQRPRHLQDPIAVLLTDQILTIHQDQNTNITPAFLEQYRGSQEEASTATGENPVKEPLSKWPPEKDQVSVTTFQATVIPGRT